MKIERQLQGTLNTVFTELIKERGLEGKIQPYPAQEENRADITLKNKNGKPIFFIELKDPTAKDGKTVFDDATIVREVGRAQLLEIKYFGNCNFLACALFDKDKIYERVSVEEGFFTLQDIARLSFKYVADKEIIGKLKHIAEFYIERALEIIERKPVSFSNLDELFIFKIRKLIEVYSHPISNKVWDKYRHNKQFERKIQNYTQSQLWNKPSTFEEIENLTHIALLMLISKLIFYKSYVDNKTWHNLYPMKVGENIETPEALETLIWEYFETFKEITGNFELLIGERVDIIFQIPFVSDAVIDLVKDVLDTGGHYNFSNIPFDIIGRIFEELIREDERHKLGQYFTPPHVIDLINSYAINNCNDKVFDPSCGSGTFLIRAYERKKNLCKEEDKGAMHENLLNEIYGNDLSGYPVYLSMLNLAIRNTRKPSYPRISNKDFFAIAGQTLVELHNQKGELEKKPLPKFDAIIGNPPYTRQEDIGTMHGTQNKDKIQALIKSECGFEPSARTSIYAYFFYHASVFLKEGGYLAFIVQNSWLDTDYGIDLQRYLSRNYEIIAIMDSEVERFFPTASVNTSIVIARKQGNEEKRNKNMVKFIYFTAPLAETIKTYKGVDKLHDILQLANHNISNEYFKLNCVKQRTLTEQTKWGQFLKAPKVYFDILEKGKKSFKNLAGTEGISTIQRGITSGCNEYFFGEDITDLKSEGLMVSLNRTDYIKNSGDLKKAGLRIFRNGLHQCFLIEKEFLQKAVKLTRDISLYIIDKVNPEDVIFYVNRLNEFKGEKGFEINKYRNDMKKHFPFAYSYIRWGESLKVKEVIVSQKSTCASRPAWWDLGEQNKMDFVLQRFRDKRNWLPVVETKFLLGDVAFLGEFKNPKLKKQYSVILNSTFSILQTELLGRVNLGDGLLTTYGPDLEAIKVLDVIPNESLQKEIDSVYESLRGVEAVSIFEELGTEDENNINLNKVAKHRLLIDYLFLKMLKYSNKKEHEEILLQLYSATIQLINGRITKAQSLKGVKNHRNNIEISVYIDQLKAMIAEGNYTEKNTLTYGRQVEKLLPQITSENRLQKKIFDTYWMEKFGSFYDKKAIAAKMQFPLLLI